VFFLQACIGPFASSPAAAAAAASGASPAATAAAGAVLFVPGAGAALSAAEAEAMPVAAPFSVAAEIVSMRDSVFSSMAEADDCFAEEGVVPSVLEPAAAAAAVAGAAAAVLASAAAEPGDAEDF